MTKMRYFSGSFWTPETAPQLQRLEAKGLSAAQIAEKLGTSRNSVSGRSQRLRGVYRRFPSCLRREREARARSAARQKQRQKKTDAVLGKFRQDFAPGGARLGG